jgi:hypothetical protein
VSEKTIYAEIWAQFAHEVKVSESKAFANLRENFALHAAELVPEIMTAKELTDGIEWATGHVKTDQAEHSSDPMLIMEQWMQGLVELSRIPMGKVS